MSIYRGKNKNEVYLASVLYDAIEDQDLDSVKTLLDVKGADPNLVLPKQRISPFHLVIGNDSDDFALKVTELILIHGGDPNVRSDEGLTPVHIAAAWGRHQVLKLLLNCGGDPQIRDMVYKTPVHYAYEEGFPECLNLLKEYLPDTLPFRNDHDNLKYYDLVLEKILVNNGSTIGEYEIVNEYKTASIQNKDEGLKQLPESNSNDYIIDWFNKNLNSTPVTPITSLIKTSSSIETKSESSLDESDNDNRDFRVKNVKTKTSPKPIPNLTLSPCKNKDFSKISGVTEFSDFSQQNGKPETSSDYVTCSPATAPSVTNVLEMNVFDITEDLSIMTNDETKSQAKSEGIGSSDLSFVSVSEVYKYVDKDEGVVLFEHRFIKSHAISDGSERSSLASLPKTIDYDSDTLRKELTIHGYNPGPITFTTKRVYLKKLQQLKRNPLTHPVNNQPIKKAYSLELEKTLKDSDWLKNLTVYKNLEDVIVKQFTNPDPSRKWREGVNKSSFTYLLLDPRISCNLPFRAEALGVQQIWETFLSSIFYVGKGKRSRPYQHLYDAVNLWQKGEKTDSKKLNKILDIWRDGSGVICLHVFQNTIPVEAYTREAAMIAALKIDNVCNIKMGDFYGSCVAWPQRDKKMLGVYLLYKAMRIFLNEGERQLRPNDID